MSRFLMYKIAIRCSDTRLAAECLQAISSASKKSQDLTLLYGCILDAQQVGDKLQTLAGLQLVLEKLNYGSQTEVHLPSLLRLTIGIMVAVLQETPKHGSAEALYTIDKLCTAFEKGEHIVLVILLEFILIFHRRRCSTQITKLIEGSRLGVVNGRARVVFEEFIQSRHQASLNLGPTLFTTHVKELPRFHRSVS